MGKEGFRGSDVSESKLGDLSKGLGLLIKIGGTNPDCCVEVTGVLDVLAPLLSPLDPAKNIFINWLWLLFFWRINVTHI